MNEPNILAGETQKRAAPEFSLPHLKSIPTVGTVQEPDLTPQQAEYTSVIFAWLEGLGQAPCVPYEYFLFNHNDHVNAFDFGTCDRHTTI